MKKLLITICLVGVYLCVSAEQAEPCDSLYNYLAEKMQPYMSHIRQVGWEDGSDRVTFFLQNVYCDSLINRININKKEWLLQVNKMGTEQGQPIADFDGTSFWWPYDADMLCLYLLDDSQYVELMKDAMELYSQHEIDYTLFEAVIFPDPSLTTSIAKNYNNEGVQEVLEIMLNDTSLESALMHEGHPHAKCFQQLVQSLKSGELWNGNDQTPGIKEYSNTTKPQLDDYKNHQ